VISGPPGPTAVVTDIPAQVNPLAANRLEAP
jgi:hypothetical protein